MIPIFLFSNAEMFEGTDVLHFGFISPLVRIVQCVFLEESYRLFQVLV